MPARQRESHIGRDWEKVRHLEVAQLWLQEKVASGEITVEKVNGGENWADALTKYVGREDLENHLRSSKQTITDGRHQLMPQVGA